MNKKNSKTLLTFLTLILFLLPFFFPGILVGIFGFLYILINAVQYGLKGGLFGAALSSITLLLFLAMSPFEVFPLKIVGIILAMFLFGYIHGYKSDKYKRELKYLKDEYINLIEKTKDWIWEVDTEGRLIFSNKMGPEITGYSLNEIIGMRFIALIHPLEQKQFQTIFTDTMKDTKPLLSFTVNLTHAKGHLITIELNASPFFDQKGHLLGYRGIGRDITQRKEEKAIRREEHQRLTTILDSIESFIYVADMKTHELLFINSFGQKKWGDISGQKCWEVIQKQEGPCPFCTNDLLMDREKTPTGIYQWTMKSPRDNKWYYCLDQAITWIDGRLVRLQMASDITREKIMEEERLIQEQFMAFSVNALALSDRESNLIYVNPSFLKMWGYQRKEEVLGQSMITFFPTKEMGEKVFQSVKEKGSWSGEFVGRKASRESFDVHASISLIFNQERDPIHIAAFLLDITDSKELERTLKEKNSIVESLFANSPNLLSIMDKKGNYIMVSESTSKIIGKKREEMLGRNYQDLVPKEVSRQIQQNIERLEKEKEALSVLNQIQVDGEKRYYEAWLFPVRIEDNSIQLIGEIATDITTQRQGAKKIKRSEELLRASQRLTRVGGWEWDIGNQTMFWTDEAYLIHDFVPGELVPGTPEHIAQSMECYLPEDRPIIEEAFQRCVQEGEPYDLEFPFVTAKGRKIWIRTLAEPVIEDGKIVRVIGNIMDITRHKQTEKNLEEYTSEIELRNLELESLYDYLDREIEKAKKIHERTLPKTLPKTERLSLGAYYQPAEKMGGDFYDAILKEDKLVTYVSDVTGHGLESALLSSFVKDMIKSYTTFNQRDNITAGNILRFLSQQYRDSDFPEDYFVCIFLTVLDLKTFQLEYIGAGLQEYQLLAIGGEDPTYLHHSGLPVSSAYPEELLIFQEERVILPKDATLLLHTDGITEQWVGKEPYGNRLEKVFFKHAHHPPDTIVDLIKEDFRSFNQDSLQGNDDITFLVIQML